MAIFRVTNNELDSFNVQQDLNVRTNAKARTNQRAETPNKFQTYANVLAGRTPDGKQKLTGNPSAKELREARTIKANNEEKRNRSTRSKKV